MNPLLPALLVLASTPPVEQLTLDEAIRAAQSQTRDIIRAKADMLLLDVEEMRALAPVLPTLDLNLNVAENFEGNLISESRSIVPVTGDPIFEAIDAQINRGPYRDTQFNNNSAPRFLLGLTGRQLIYDGGRWWTVIARVDDIRDVRTAALKTVENNVRLNVVRSFYNYAKSIEGVKTVQQQVLLSEGQLKRSRSLHKAGRGKMNDVAAALRNLASDRVVLARREFTAASNRRLLNIAMGRDPAYELTLILPKHIGSATTGPAAVLLAPRDEMLERALAQRPELVQNRANLEVIKKNVTIQGADYWPVVSFVARYAKASRRPDRVFNDPTQNYTASLALDFRWNLFRGRADEAEVINQEIQLTKQQATVDDLERTIRREVHDQYERTLLLAEVYELALDSARAAEEAVRLAKGEYRLGKGTFLELRDAELRLTQSRLSVIEARFDIEVANEELRRAVGGEF